MELSLPCLSRVDGAWGEKTAHLPQGAGLGGHDVAWRAFRAELIDEAAKILPQLGIPDEADRGVAGRVPGEGRKEAVAREMPAHRLSMRHIVSLCLEMDCRCHALRLVWSATP
jgi:hypothetical protein